jgi:hypothetical protein
MNCPDKTALKKQDYTVRNKYDALNDEDFDASTRYSVQD